MLGLGAEGATLGRGDGVLGRGTDGVTEGRGDGVLGRGTEGPADGRGAGTLGRGAEGVTLGRGLGVLGRGTDGVTEGRGDGVLGRGTEGVTDGRGVEPGLGTDGRGLEGFTRLGIAPDGVLEGNVVEVPDRLGNLEFPFIPPPTVTRDGRFAEALGRGLVDGPGVLGIDTEGRDTTRFVVPGAAEGTALATGTRSPSSLTCRCAEATVTFVPL